MASLRSVVTAAAFLAILASHPTAAPEYSDWVTPINLGPVVNSPYNDLSPGTSKDGLSLYFGSDRPGGFGGIDIWVSHRSSVDAPWGPPMNLGGVVNTAGTENAPNLSRDEHWLFLNSNRAGGFGSNDLWASYRQHTRDDFGWQDPVNLGAGVNGAFLDQGASYLEIDESGAHHALLYFTSDRPGGPGMTDIYVSELLPDGSFGPAALVPELSSPVADQRPSVRFDGLELFFYSNRPGGFGFTDLWVATRPTPFATWSAPENLGPVVNSADPEQQAHIAADRRTLYFAGFGSVGGLDLWVTTRSRQHP